MDSCKRCDSALLGGRCIDPTCPFFDHDETCPVGWAEHPEHDTNDDAFCTCEVTPTCDICDEPEDQDPTNGREYNWNGETGNHQSCEWNRAEDTRITALVVEAYPTLAPVFRVKGDSL